MGRASFPCLSNAPPEAFDDPQQRAIYGSLAPSWPGVVGDLARLSEFHDFTSKTCEWRERLA
jgi:hypothetical protein